MSLWDIVREFFQPPTKPDYLPSDLFFKGQSALLAGTSDILGPKIAIHYVNLGANPVHITARMQHEALKPRRSLRSALVNKGFSEYGFWIWIHSRECRI
jgi:hypothetical protein